MVHIIKVYFTGPKENVQIRRLAVNSDVVSKFDLLAWKIREMFPGLSQGHIEVTWKDSENDVIHMSTDEELAQALASADDDILRIYAYSIDNQECNDNEKQNLKSSHNEIHQDITCDGCDKTIEGYRYKCLQCRNFDLCSVCNAANKHENHDMIKLVRPVHIAREWVFPGARKIWRSMFGRCPHSYFTESNDNEGAAKCDPKKPLFPGLLDDLLKGGVASADKLIKENLGNFLNFIESVSGNLDVKLERDAPCAKSKGSRKGSQGNKTGQKINKGSSKVEPTSAAAPCCPAEPLLKDVPVHVMPEQLDNFASSNMVEKEQKEKMAEPCGLFGNLDKKAHEVSGEAKEEEKMDEIAQKLINLAEPSVGENNSTSAGNLTKQENSAKPCCTFENESCEGWTILHKQEDEKNDTKFVNDNGTKPKYPSIYPSMFVHADSGEASQANGETKLKEVIPAQAAKILDHPLPVFREESDKFANSKQDQTASTNYDPEIMNALMKMQAMGFTNEGGWLERLLLTKDGNINATLDALYPNTRRH